LNAPSDGNEVIACSSAFQTFAAAMGKPRSSMVLCNDCGHLVKDDLEGLVISSWQLYCRYLT